MARLSLGARSTNSARCFMDVQSLRRLGVQFPRSLGMRYLLSIL